MSFKKKKCISVVVPQQIWLVRHILVCSMWLTSLDAGSCMLKGKKVEQIDNQILFFAN